MTSIGSALRWSPGPRPIRTGISCSGIPGSATCRATPPLPAPGLPLVSVRGRRRWRRRARRASLSSWSGSSPPLPADGGPVPGEVVEHEAHAIGHAAVLLADRGVLLAGDMLSDVLIPLLDPRRPDQVGTYQTALDRLGRGRPARRGAGPRSRCRCRGARGGGTSRRGPRLHRRAAARRGTSRRASGPGLAPRPPPVEP